MQNFLTAHLARASKLGHLALSTPRIHLDIPLEPGSEVTIKGTAYAHAIRVLRLKVNSPLILFCHGPFDYPAKITHIDRHVAIALISERTDNPMESAISIHLGLAISKSDHMDFAIQKSVELGVTSISPLQSSRSIFNASKTNPLKITRKLQRWHDIIISASEQSGRSEIPRLHPVTAFQEWLLLSNSSLKILLDHRADSGFKSLTPATSIDLLIGPEGGFTEEETKIALGLGFSQIRIGPRILRTETAPLAAITAIQLLWGDLG